MIALGRHDRTECMVHRRYPSALRPACFQFVCIAYQCVAVGTQCSDNAPEQEQDTGWKT